MKRNYLIPFFAGAALPIIIAILGLLFCSCSMSTNYKAVYIAKDGSTIVEQHYTSGGAIRPTLKAGKVYIFSHFIK